MKENDPTLGIALHKEPADLDSKGFYVLLFLMKSCQPLPLFPFSKCFAFMNFQPIYIYMCSFMPSSWYTHSNLLPSFFFGKLNLYSFTTYLKDF